MPLSSLTKLIGLAAIWGGSFLFMRIAAPILGPVLLIQIRVALAAVFLLVVALIQSRRLDVRAHWRHFLILGVTNTAFPFFLFAWAAQTLPASLLSVLNATSPIWGAVLASVWTRTKLPLKTIAGLGLGVAGVAILVGFDAGHLTPKALLGVAAGLIAACSYAVAALYSRYAKSVDAFSNAHGSMWAATLVMIPAVPFFPAVAMPNLWVMICVALLGIVCSGIAYILYFKLVDEIGGAQALTVTFLVPIFGVLWGSLILHEHVGPLSLVGAAFIITGTALITGFSPSGLFRRSKAAQS